MQTSSLSTSVIQKSGEMLLIGSSSSDPFSNIIVDPRTGVSTWSYKGSELQGATPGLICPLGITGDHLLISTKDRPLINVFAIHNRDRFHQKAVLSGIVTSMCTTSDGTFLFASIRTQIYIWLLTTGELLSVTDAHYQDISVILLSSDESMLFSSSNDGAIHCYLVSDLVSSDRDIIVEPCRKWRAHSLAIRGLVITHGSNPRIASCGLDHVASIHSVSLDACLLKISADRPLTACALDPAESRLFLGSDLGNIAQLNLYSMIGKQELLIQTVDEKNENIPVFNGHSEEITVLVVNGDGSLLASGDASGKYCIWDIVSKQCLKVSTMRGSISTLRFIPNWSSLTSSEYVSRWKPVFNLQRNPSNGQTISIMESSVKDDHTDFWHAQSDDLIGKAIFEMSDNQTVKKGKIPKKQQKISPSNVVEDLRNDVIMIEDDSETTSLDEKDSETVKKLREEITRLKKINAQLYEFATKELLVNKD
uniref:WD_REPEATS_REGION domain-containing protein n=1 Tax=Heterorhabditis bacteriophora TaxID=37862 RepID=A0A1I7XPG5_HETBA